MVTVGQSPLLFYSNLVNYLPNLNYPAYSIQACNLTIICLEPLASKFEEEGSFTIIMIMIGRRKFICNNNNKEKEEEEKKVYL